MFFKLMGRITPQDFWDGLRLVLKKLDQIIMKQSELAQSLRNQTSILVKIGGETTTLLEKITALEEALANQDNVSEEVQTAFDELKTQAQAVDDEVPDATELANGAGKGGATSATGATGATGETGAIGVPEKPENPEPDVENMNAHAQTAQEQMMEAAPGTLPDVERAAAAAEANGEEAPAATGTPEPGPGAADTDVAIGNHAANTPEEEKSDREREAGASLARTGRDLPPDATEAAKAGFQEARANNNTPNLRGESDLPGV